MLNHAGRATLAGRITRTLTLLVGLSMLAVAPSPAAAEVAPAPVLVAASPVLVSGGPDNQTDPHISGTLVTYTNAGSASSEIRYHDLATGQDAAISTDGHRDSLSDVDGSTVIFRRVFTDSSSTRHPIMAFDTSNASATPVELAPDPDARRSMAAIGGGTVAWEEMAGSSSSQTDIVAHDLVTGATTFLTTDGLAVSNSEPEVSPDGSVVTWAACAPTGLGCDVHVASRSTAGGWSAPVPLSGSVGEDIQPTTDGVLVVYASDAGGDWDIHWVNVDGTGAGQLAMPGIQTNPTIDGGLVSFESEQVGSTNGDLFVYDLVTGNLYQVTSTPDVDETLNDLVAGSDGAARLVWAQADGLATGHNDVYTASFQVQRDHEGHEVCPHFDQERAYKLNSTIPIRLQLCDASGQNLSSADLVVTATGLVKIDGTAATGVVEDAGNANPDNGFRYAPDLGSYVYNLRTKDLSAGTWELRFTVSGDPATYSVRFDLR